MRREYEITQGQLDGLLAASKSTPYMIVAGHPPTSPQENANRAWRKLGHELGFDAMTVEPMPSKGERYFTAEPTNEKEAAMPYYGYVEVTVRLMRQGYGTDSSGEPGSGFGVEGEQTIRLEEGEARAFVTEEMDGHSSAPQRAIRTAVKHVLDADDRAHLNDQWKAAVQDLPVDDMRAVLDLLERRKLDRTVGPAQ